ncbi:putative bifunctional diguanylate cyclase/phosphodiesterase [Lutibaculum baratangense]|uniref:Diguanylate cyclase/phosphodiesterase (GGDEF & EAL domains) with PAS/PAC sensor(S) n=1 Tax=Lutibaculum baratangense AMV1 TaxID=631454 RepID=V4RL50_9HYPH|nr:EAL domain-containing protein [Lutibaculum baratangense]ESR26029.1 diguanylate cyclase/phosphodiesterase (GGDEF & EAL domains) with PAS/PAC sensor(s) [Lutibaculum baratangense AMV1]
MRVVGCLIYEHNLYLVALASLVCFLGALATTGLFRQAFGCGGLSRAGWVFLTGVCAGSAIWSTHFIAMLGYAPPAPVTFDATLTVLSVLVAVIGASAGFALAAAGRGGTAFLPVGGAVLGLSIAAMHYTGMFAYRVDGIVSWRADHVVASIALASGFGAAFTCAAARLRRGWARHVAPGLLVTAIVTLHFTGMAAFEVSPLPGAGVGADSEAFRAMALAVALVGFIIVGTGITSQLIESRTRAESSEQLRHMALHDPLTGLPNRTQFATHLERLVADCRSGQTSCALIGIDLDRFKELNDTFGHEAGDEALCALAARMREFERAEACFARVGGDEFFVALPFDTQDELRRATREIEAMLTTPLDVGGRSVSLGAGLGVAVYPRDGADADVLVRNADLAMYRAKGAGQDSVCFYDTEMGQFVRERRMLARDLRAAIDTDSLAVHYQVQTSVETGEIMGYEALLRWRHPVRGLVPPDEFIPLAEESGLILELGEWVLRRACADAARWSPPYGVAVNLSAVQLVDANLPHLVHEVLVSSGLSPARLELELTETALIRDRARSLHAIRQIKALGVSVALDDFGTGYSSLETLRSFPFDKIKLDRSFVQDVCTDAQSLAIVRAVTALGRSLTIAVLAEGIETKAQLDLLKAERCDGAQGFLMGRPMPVEDLPAHGGPRRVADEGEGVASAVPAAAGIRGAA